MLRSSEIILLSYEHQGQWDQSFSLPQDNLANHSSFRNIALASQDVLSTSWTGMFLTEALASFPNLHHFDAKPISRHKQSFGVSRKLLIASLTIISIGVRATLVQVFGE